MQCKATKVTKSVWWDCPASIIFSGRTL